MTTSSRYLIVQPQVEPGSVVTVAKLSEHNGLSPANPQHNVEISSADIEPFRAYMAMVTSVLSSRVGSTFKTSLLREAQSEKESRPSLQRRRLDLMGSAASNLSAHATIDADQSFSADENGPELVHPPKKIVEPFRVSTPVQRWITAIPRRYTGPADLRRAIEHDWRGIRPDLMRYDDAWLDLREGIDGLVPIVRYETSSAEARELGTLIVLGPADGVQRPFDYLDFRDPEIVDADLPLLAGELLGLEANGMDASEALRRLLHEDVDPRLVARLRAAAAVAERRGLAGRLLEWTLDRAGWPDIERRVLQEAETRLLERLEERSDEILSRIEAAQALLPSVDLPRVDDQFDQPTQKKVGIDGDVEDRLIGLAEEIEESLIAKFKDFAMSRDASRGAALEGLARQVDELRQEIESSIDEVPPYGRDKPFPIPGVIGRASRVQHPDDRCSVIHEAGAEIGLDANAVALLVVLSATGYLPVLPSSVAGDVGGLLAGVAGGGHLFRLDCDPTLVTFGDAESRLKATGILDVHDEGCAVLLLRNINLSPAVYWLDAFSETMRERARHVIAFGSVADHPFRHGLTRDQLGRVAPINIAGGDRVAMAATHPRRFPAAAMLVTGDAKADPADVPLVADPAHLRKLTEIAIQSKAIFGVGIAQAEAQVHVDRLVAWWTAVSTGAIPSDGVGALLVGEGSWS
ncbi:MAG: hypothetical protein NXI14_06940 [bacterium]|nr:hypothetical protein [bacterium]